MFQKQMCTTSEEAASPMKLADQSALSFRGTLEHNNWQLVKPSWSHTSFAAMRAIAGSQPKASKLPPLVSEHQSIVKIEGPTAILADFGPPTMKRIDTSMTVPESCESQLLRTSTFRDKGGSGLNQSMKQVAWFQSKFRASLRVSVALWVRLISSGHPKKFSALLPLVLKHAIDIVT